APEDRLRSRRRVPYQPPHIDSLRYIKPAQPIDNCQYVMQNRSMTTLPVTIDATSPQASCCPPAADAMVDDATAQDLAKVFKALGDPNRVKLFSLITASASGEMCVCDLTGPVGLSQPTVS